MTPAEFAAMQSRLSMSDEMLGDAFDDPISARTIKTWRTGKRLRSDFRIRPGVEDEMLHMEKLINDAVEEMNGAFAGHRNVVLLLYRNSDDMLLDDEFWAMGAHLYSVAASRFWFDHRDRGARLVWFEPVEFDAWRGASPDTHETRQAWARHVVNASDAHG